jgi:hypothetical protein
MQAWAEGGAAERRLRKVDLAALSTAMQRAAATVWQDVVAGCDPRNIPDEQHSGIKLSSYIQGMVPAC